MKLEITGENEREKIGALLDSCNVGLSPNVLIAQARRSFWDEGGAGKVFLLLAAISPATAKKIRALLEKEACKRRERST